MQAIEESTHEIAAMAVLLFFLSILLILGGTRRSSLLSFARAEEERRTTDLTSIVTLSELAMVARVLLAAAYPYKQRRGCSVQCVYYIL